MAGFENDVLIAERGELTRSSAGQFLQFSDGTDTSGLYTNAGTPEGSVAADIGSICLDTTNGIVYTKTTDTANTGWSSTAASGTRLRAGYVENIGINYNGGTGVFTIQGADASLSASNPGYITLPSKADPGEMVLYELTADQSFIDDVGASEIIGNLFGLTTGVAWAEDCPFYIYAVGNDDEDTIAFMLARVPHYSTSPAAANIGAPDDPVSDLESDFWSIDNIDETLYDSNPCMSIGSIRMRMTTSDDWTVQTLNTTDGIGSWNEKTQFKYPKGQLGCASGTWIISNAGTEPAFTNNLYTYYVKKDGLCIVSLLSGACTTAGVGAQQMEWTVPFNKSIDASTWVMNGTKRQNSGGNYFNFGPNVPETGNPSFFFYSSGQTAFLLNTIFAINDTFEFSGTFQISNNGL